MPSSYPHLISKELFVSQIQRFIPKAWKEGIKQLEKPSSILDLSLQAGDSMIDSLLASVKTYAREGHLLEAFKSLSLIKLHPSSSISCDAVLESISSLILSCTSHKSFPQGKQLHAHIIRLGLEQHPILVPKLVTFYSSFDSHGDAHTVLENSNILHPLPWNLLISSYVKNELLEEALATYEQMVNKGIRPDCFTYPSVLKACAEKLDIGFGKEVHKSIDASCQEWNLFVHNALVSMYGKFGLVDVARQLFDNMPQRDIISWNSMISCYASRGMWNEAFEVFGNLQMEGTNISIITWNTIAGGCLRTGKITGALELLSKMRVGGTRLDSVAFTIGLSASSHIGAIKLGKEMHGSAIRSYCDGYDNVQNALITMYSRCKNLRHAYTLFQSIEDRSIITWNSMISGFSHMDRAEEASFIFRKMMCCGIKPNYVTIASILPVCARVANLQHGKEFHCYITKHVEFVDYLLLWNALVDIYARSGRVVDAKKVFDTMNEKDEVTYTSMIAGYGVQGEGKAALKLFEEMNRLKIKPDHVTMVSVLSACSHSGLMIQGQNIFERMLSMYGITPDVEHYGCMVDLFGRAGLLHNAKNIIKRMPYKPTSAMWATLIGACRIHGNTEIGEWAAEMLLQMRPENSGYYVLIANMYAAAGRWNNLANVRTFMRDLGVRKDPGSSWVDVGDGFSLFLVGDTSNQLRKEIYILLDGLSELMKDADYIRQDYSANYTV
ncbi:pentatricopeptide repeat-containing protein At1g71490 [Argentina anserina]|uniref:pentatricopeptide repeat-containing protein At1g71490 n=1 Tax=Argentina anserina TaxID=57926 RepID=UPI0021764918|nr:pentatricopeptide repeat-containing protein At1g71490 [Potentilla anserina]XP_050377136.1 pentatricopeptide repeat-containing protein At1g71490 [Potentilla anserina]